MHANLTEKRLKQASFIQEMIELLLEHYHVHGSAHILDSVIELCQMYANLIVVCDPEARPCALVYLGNALLAKHQLYQDLNVLEKAIAHYQRAQEYPRLRSCDRLGSDIGLARALHHRYMALVRSEDEQMALAICSRMLESLDNDIPSSNRAWALTAATVIRTCPYIWSNTELSLHESQQLQRRIRDTRRDLRNVSQSILSIIADIELCLRIADYTRELQPIDEAEQLVEQVLSVCSSQAEVLFSWIMVLRWIITYEARRSNKDPNARWKSLLDIANSMQPHDLAPTNVILRCQIMHYRAYSAFYSARSQGVLSGMEWSITLYKEAFELCPRSHLFKRRLISNLAGLLLSYSQHSGQISVVEEVLVLQDQYRDLVLRSEFLALNIAESLLERAQVSNQSTARYLIGQAISLCQARQYFLRQCDEGKPVISARSQFEREMANLEMIDAARMQIRAGDTPVLEVDEILDLIQEGLKGEIQITAGQIRYTLAQTEIYVIKARAHHDTSLLDKAETLLEEQLSSLKPDMSSYRVDLLTALADVAVARFDVSTRSTKSQQLSRAWDLFRRASTSTPLRANQRFKSNLKWATFATERGCYHDAFEAYTCALDVLPEVVFRGEDLFGRIEALRQIDGLAASSAASALSVGDPASAIDFMEKSRNIIWLQSMKFNGSLEHLNALPTILRERFCDIGQALQKADQMSWIARRGKAEELDKVIVDIRGISGFERFLLPPAMGEIERHLQIVESYTIVIIPGISCSDILVLGVEQGHRHFQITSLNTSHITRMVHDFKLVCSDTRSAARDSFNGVRAIHTINPQEAPADLNGLLSELWQSLILPVMRCLGFERASLPEHRKRVWWCPLGMLSTLPLHAAGVYEGPTPEHVGDYVLSSYTTSLSALHGLLVKGHDVEHQSSLTPRMVLIAQAESKSLPPLLNVESEIYQVRRVVPKDTHISESIGVRVETALSCVQSATILHLACHGLQDQENPLRSGFELTDGRLTVGDLMGVDIPHAQLAYLSACSSAGMDESRPDQNLNLASTMLYAGFKSVIATLWTMDDIDGPFMAERIYQRIFKNGSLDLDAVPLALEDAAKELRESGAPPSRWATYVHLGL